MNPTIRECLAKAVNRSLQKVIGDFHLFGMTLSATPNSVWMYFNDQEPIRISGASDGEHIQLDQVPASLIEMGKYGEMMVRDISTNSVFEFCIEKKLQGAWTIEAPQGHIIGVRFDFGEGHKPMVLNWGPRLPCGRTRREHVGFLCSTSMVTS